MKSFKTKAGTELPLMNIKGKDYLQVAHRIVWMREEHQDWSITTELKDEPNACLAKATISNGERIIATAHKYEDKQGFGDYREKAETGAIGRALALCGYGTQFCADELDEKDRLADSPIGKSTRIEQPPADLGVQRDEYVVPYGPCAKKYISDCDPVVLRQFILEREAAYEKSGKPHGAWFIELLKHAEPYIAAFENATQAG